MRSSSLQDYITISLAPTTQPWRACADSSLVVRSRKSLQKSPSNASAGYFGPAHTIISFWSAPETSACLVYAPRATSWFGACARSFPTTRKSSNKIIYCPNNISIYENYHSMLSAILFYLGFSSTFQFAYPSIFSTSSSNPRNSATYRKHVIKLFHCYNIVPGPVSEF